MIEYKIINYTKANGGHIFKIFKKQKYFWIPLWIPLGHKLTEVEVLDLIFCSFCGGDESKYVTTYIEDAKYMCMADAKEYFDNVAEMQGEKIISVNSEVFTVKLEDLKDFKLRVNPDSRFR